MCVLYRTLSRSGRPGKYGWSAIKYKRLGAKGRTKGQADHWKTNAYLNHKKQCFLLFSISPTTILYSTITSERVLKYSTARTADCSHCLTKQTTSNCNNSIEHYFTLNQFSISDIHIQIQILTLLIGTALHCKTLHKIISINIRFQVDCWQR